MVATSPLLSVIIPTFNRRSLVGEAIESALAQDSSGLDPSGLGHTYPSETNGEERERGSENTGIEVVVVDDGSSDGTVPYLRERYGDRIVLVVLEKNRGIAAARNAGICVARGEFLALLDSDDLWLPGKWEAEQRVFHEFPTADVVVSDARTFLEGQGCDRSWFDINGLLEASGGEVSWMSECQWLWGDWDNNLATCSFCFRRRVLDQLGLPLFDESLRLGGEDWEFHTRLYNTCRVAVLPQVLAYVRRADDTTRLGRTTPGKPMSASQTHRFLTNKLHILERVRYLANLPPDIAENLELSIADTRATLAQPDSPHPVPTPALSG